MTMVDEDGDSDNLQLLPGLTADELVELGHRLPCPIPSDVQELLSYTAGFANGPLDSLDFAGALPFEAEDIFSFGLSIAHDGFGNYWVIDLKSDSVQWGPIFFACHDPAVIIYQCGTLEQFLEDVLAFANPPHQSAIDQVHETYCHEIWRFNPNVLSFQDCLDSEDEELKNFAMDLGDSFQVIDLRNPKLGDGFSWGRYGPQTVIRRFGEMRLFAYQVRTPIFRKIFHSIFGGR